MTKSSKAKLEYQAAYNKRPEQKALGVERRRERRHEIAAGKVAIGDGKDIAHIKAASAGGKTAAGNLKVEAATKNRGWRKGEAGYKVPKDSK
jgi:allophanate hydrolase subunit 1